MTAAGLFVATLLLSNKTTISILRRKMYIYDLEDAYILEQYRTFLINIELA